MSTPVALLASVLLILLSVTGNVQGKKCCYGDKVKFTGEGHVIKTDGQLWTKDKFYIDRAANLVFRTVDYSRSRNGEVTHMESLYDYNKGKMFYNHNNGTACYVTDPDMSIPSACPYETYKKTGTKPWVANGKTITVDVLNKGNTDTGDSATVYVTQEECRPLYSQSTFTQGGKKSTITEAYASYDFSFAEDLTVFLPKQCASEYDKRKVHVDSKHRVL